MKAFAVDTFTVVEVHEGQILRKAIKSDPRTMQAIGAEMGRTRARKPLKWGTEQQMYSLRDTGIVQKFRDGLPLHVVMQLAAHRTPDVTAEYIAHVDPDVQERVLKGAKGL